MTKLEPYRATGKEEMLPEKSGIHDEQNILPKPRDASRNAQRQTSVQTMKISSAWARVELLIFSIPSILLNLIVFPVSAINSACGSICIPAYAGAVSSIGGWLGFDLIDENEVFVFFLLLSVCSILYGVIQSGEGVRALALAALGSSFVILGKFQFSSQNIESIGHLMLVIGSIWNFYPSYIAVRHGVCRVNMKHKQRLERLRLQLRTAIGLQAQREYKIFPGDSVA